MFEHFAGIDMAKDTFSFCVTDLNGKEVEKGCCPVDKEGFDKFFSVISSFSNIAVAVESTGTYHITLLSALVSANFTTYLITPILVKKFAQSCSLRTIKTDRIDAKIISVFIARNHSTLIPAVSTGNEGLRELARLRESVTGDLGSTKTKLKQLLTTTFPELVRNFNIFTASMLVLIEAFPSANAFVNASETEIETPLKTKGKGRKISVSVKQFQELASKSVGKSDPMIEKAVLHQIRKIRFLTDELKKVTEELVEAAHICSGKEIEILTSIPGIGDTTAAQFIAEIGNIDKFDSVKQLTAYAGTDPGINQSGMSLKRKKISKKGNASIRRVGFLMTVHVIRFSDVFNKYYFKKRNEGMAKKKAIIATFNKLLRCMFAMLKNHSHFLFVYS